MLCVAVVMKSNSLSGAAIHGIIPWFSRTSGTFLQGQLLFSKVETCLNSKSDGLEVPWLVRSRGRVWGPELVCIDLWAPYGGFLPFLPTLGARFSCLPRWRSVQRILDTQPPFPSDGHLGWDGLSRGLMSKCALNCLNSAWLLVTLQS